MNEDYEVYIGTKYKTVSTLEEKAELEWLLKSLKETKNCGQRTKNKENKEQTVIK